MRSASSALLDTRVNEDESMWACRYIGRVHTGAAHARYCSNITQTSRVDHERAEVLEIAHGADTRHRIITGSC